MLISTQKQKPYKFLRYKSFSKIIKLTLFNIDSYIKSD